MKNLILIALAVATLAGLAFTPATTPSTAGEGGIEWMTFDEAVKAAKKNKKGDKKIFIDLYTDWCGWCKVMDKKTFADPTIAAYMNANFYAVKFNAEQKGVIDFNGKEYKFVASGKRGYHELAANLVDGRMSYPSFVILDGDFKRLEVLAGFQDPAKFDPKLKYYGGDHYKTKDYQTFYQKYQSPFTN